MLNRLMYRTIAELESDIENNSDKEELLEDLKRIEDIFRRFEALYIHKQFSESVVLREILDFLQEQRDENDDDFIKMIKGEKAATKDWYLIENLIEMIEWNTLGRFRISEEKSDTNN